MSHAIPQAQPNSSTLEAEIQCGSHAGVCHGQGHTDFLYSCNGCAKKKKKRSSEYSPLQMSAGKSLI
jgi:hypothetical protein